MAKSVIVIGAGIAGLSAGCYGRMSGYETRIFELHDKPGGLCTSWTRRGYTFDGCIDWLVGSAPGTGFHKIWSELGAVQGRRMVDHEEFTRYEGEDGKTFIVYTDIDRLEQHMKELAPGDAELTRDFAACIRKAARVDPPVGPPRGILDLLKMGLTIRPLLSVLQRYGKLSVQDYAKQFGDAFLAEALASSFDIPDFPVAVVMFTFASMSARNAAYPIGGSLEFARAIERRYLGLGGEVHYRSPVDKILVERDRAVGVRLRDGTEHRADHVVSAADGHATIFDMLEGKYLDDRIRGYYSGGLEPFPPMIQVSLGVARDLSAEPRSASFPLRKPVVIAGKERRRMGYRHYCFDPTMAPPGKSVLVSGVFTDYEYWRALSSDRGRYEAEKKQIGEAVTMALDERFPGIKDQVEAVDVATPMTYERYTGNWRGSFEGWLITTRTAGMAFGKGLPTVLPGLTDFHMIGQWTTPGGGLPPAARQGRDVIRDICRQDRKPFVTQVP